MYSFCGVDLKHINIIRQDDIEELKILATPPSPPKKLFGAVPDNSGRVMWGSCGRAG
jgi:hypothetical protein